MIICNFDEFLRKIFKCINCSFFNQISLLELEKRINFIYIKKLFNFILNFNEC